VRAACRAPLPTGRTSTGRNSFPPVFPRDADSSCDAALRPFRRGLENRCTRKRTEGSNPSPPLLWLGRAKFAAAARSSTKGETSRDRYSGVNERQRTSTTASAAGISFPPPFPRSPARARGGWPALRGWKFLLPCRRSRVRIPSAASRKTCIRRSFHLASGRRMRRAGPPPHLPRATRSGRYGFRLKVRTVFFLPGAIRSVPSASS
jgi:hypothetical protein